RNSYALDLTVRSFRADARIYRSLFSKVYRDLSTNTAEQKFLRPPFVFMAQFWTQLGFKLKKKVTIE
ncbi:hypothetical protein K0M31_000503, partial [Melipona bicolor]